MTLFSEASWKATRQEGDDQPSPLGGPFACLVARPLQASVAALETGLLNEVSLGSLARKGFILEEIRPLARLAAARLLRLLFH